MIEPRAQGADETFAELAPFLSVMYPIAEAAVQASREFFGDDAVDPSLFPNLVRYHIKSALNAEGLDAVDDDAELEHTILSNNGLLVRCGSRQIRIRKADHGGLPVASSGALRQFYEQRSMLEEPVPVQKLVLLWDLVNGVLELSLVCPKDYDSAPHWHVPIEHPAEVHTPAVVRHDESDFDVPIQLPSAAADGR